MLYPGGMTDEAASSGVNVMIPTRTLGGGEFLVMKSTPIIDSSWVHGSSPRQGALA
jgi:hypothetical protein